MDLRKELTERFQNAQLSYLEATERLTSVDHWYLEGTERPTDPDLAKRFSAIADRYDHLLESVDAIPAEAIRVTQQLASAADREKFDEIMEESLVQVGRSFFPNSAAEFVATLNITLRFVELSHTGE